MDDDKLKEIVEELKIDNVEDIAINLNDYIKNNRQKENDQLSYDAS